MIEDILNHGEMKWAEIADTIGYKYGGDSLRKYFSKNATQAQKNELRSMRMSSEDYLQTEKETQSGDMVKVFDGGEWLRIKDKSDEDILRSIGVDPTIFKLDKSYASSYGDGDKFSIRVNFSPKIDGFDINEYVDMIKREITPVPIEKTLHQQTGVNAVLPLFDMHFGMDGIDYTNLLGSIAGELEWRKPDELVIVLGGDFLHWDSSRGETTAGTKVGTFNQDAVYMATRWLIQLINESNQQANTVRLIAVTGNHDLALTQVLLATLEASTGIEFEGRGESETYGINLGDAPIVFYHGGGQTKNKIKPGDFLKFTHNVHAPQAMKSLATGKPVHWVIGHLHSEKTWTDGVVIHQAPSVYLHSDYEVSNGWVDSQNHTKILYFNDTDLIGEWRV